MPSAIPFDLFGEFTDEGQKTLESRKLQKQQEISQLISSLPSDPERRTTAENRLVFHHQHKALFGQPGRHSALLDPHECQSILNTCRKKQQWTIDRHSAFATTDIPIRTDPDLHFLESLIKQRLFPELASHYQFKVSDLEFRDIFLVKYSADAQRGLRLHTDGCLFAITLLISHQDDFEGGGTYFKSIDDIVYLDQGSCAYHDARVLHSGVDITKGERYILVGFIDTVDTIAKDNRSMLRA